MQSHLSNESVGKAQMSIPHSRRPVTIEPIYMENVCLLVSCVADGTSEYRKGYVCKAKIILKQQVNDCALMLSDNLTIIGYVYGWPQLLHHLPDRSSSP